MKRPSGSRRVGTSCPLTAPKPSAKNAVDSRVAKVGLPSSKRRKPAGKGAKGHTPPKGGQLSTLRHTKVPKTKKGCLLNPLSAASLQKVICCVQGPCETGETLDYPSMVCVPLCTKLEMSDINKGTKVPPGHPPLPLSTTRLLGTRSQGSHSYWLTALRMAKRGRRSHLVLAVTRWRCAYPPFQLRIHC